MSERFHEFLLRLKMLFRKRGMDREMAEELEFHQTLLREKLLRQGSSGQDVDAAVRRRFGNEARWHERLRELWQFARFESLLRDASFSVRLLAKSPGFTLVAVLTLALGVGANTTVFSMINGLLLRPLAVPESGRLALLGFDGGPSRNYTFPEPFFRAFERRHEVFAETFAFDHAAFQVKTGSGSEIVYGQFVSGNFFSALRVPPLMGRVLTAEDDRTGGNPAGFAAVIGESLWETRFNRAPDVLGKSLDIDNTTFIVAGVMPKQFIGADPAQRPQIFVPLADEPVLNSAQSMVKAGYHALWLTVMGRLQPSATVEQANAAVSAATDAVLRESVPNAQWIDRHERNHFLFAAESGSAGVTSLRANFRRPLVAVFAMCGGILLLACLNLASLLLARGTARQKELAARFAIGATRARLIQQLLVESLLLAMTGTAAGLAMAPLVSRALAAVLLSGSGNAHLDTSLDIRVFAFAAAAAILATLIIGLTPAIQATSRNLIERIKDGQHATRTREHRRILPRLLLSIEVALALMLVFGAGLLASSLMKLYRSGEGFDPNGVVNIAYSMDKQPLMGNALIEFYRQTGDALAQQPRVGSVSFALMLPLTGFFWDDNFSAAASGPSHDIDLNSVAPRYFETMRIPLYEGRDFTWNDTKQAGLKIVLNQTAAKQLFGGADALGKMVYMQNGDAKVQYQVVGVVGDAKYLNLHDPAPAGAYVPMTQEAGDHSISFTAVARMDARAASIAGAARSLAARMAPQIPAPEITPMTEIVDQSVSSERMMAMLAVFFAVCALTVTAIGLYGTLAYATARRTSEIGIRMALGARRAQVTRMVFSQNLNVMLAGTVTGLAAALLAARALASFLYGTSTRDPLVIALSIAALAVIASAASLLPALRASRIEPIAAIRRE